MNRLSAFALPPRPAAPLPGSTRQARFPRRAALRGGLALCVAALAWVGCASPGTSTLTEEDRQPFKAVGIQPGDRLQISFPGAPGMNTVQQVQSDGTIALPLGGSLQVQDKSATQVESELVERFGPQLVVKEVAVSIESVGFPVFISGAVLRPGRIQCRESVTLLEALVEAGGPIQGRANLKKVRVVRQRNDGTTSTYVLNVSEALQGAESQQFYLRPSDVIYVPERFSLY